MISYAQYRELPEDYVSRKIAEFLAEDMPEGDVTAESVFSGDECVTAYAEAQEDIVFAGAELVPVFFGAENISLCAKDGDRIPNGSIIAEFRGKTLDILRRERVFLNLIQRLSAIAGMTRRYVDLTSEYGTKILDTRKTTPGLRLFEKYAVTCGGGYNHRLDLSSGILIKDNHIAAVGGIKEAVTKVKAAGTGLKIEIEVETLDELGLAIGAGADGFLLDNMTPETTRKAVEIVRSAPRGNSLFIESSGGINLSTVAEYAQTGVDAISVGALTHGVKNANIHLEFK